MHPHPLKANGPGLRPMLLGGSLVVAALATVAWLACLTGGCTPFPSNQRALLVSSEPAYKVRYRNYPWAVPLDARRRGLVFSGSGRRLEHVASKLLAGESVTVVALGGSVTAGVGSIGPAFAWPGRLEAWLNETWPHPRGHRVLNRGVSATTSGLFALCLDKMMPSEGVDLVVVEFSFNDIHGYQPFNIPERKGFETLLRKLRRHPSAPSLLLLHFWAWWMPRLGDRGGIYYEGSAETQLALLGQYYDVPSASLRSGTYHLQRRGVGNFKVKVLVPEQGQALPEVGRPGEAFYFDARHPTDFGHAVMAELVGEAMYQAAVRLDADRAAPGAQADGSSSGGNAAEGGEELPPPMILDNPDIGVSTCFLQESFKGVVVNNSGFTYAAARPHAPTFTAQKWSWSGAAPGDWAELEFDSREDPTRPPPDGGPAANAKLGYLKSYESMGSAAVECMGGCVCSRSVLDGTWERRATLFHMHEFKVSQHPHCRVRVTILPETKSGGHKISLTFIMVTPFPVIHELRHFGEEHVNGLVHSMVA